MARAAQTSLWAFSFNGAPVPRLNSCLPERISGSFRGYGPAGYFLVLVFFLDCFYRPPQKKNDPSWGQSLHTPAIPIPPPGLKRVFFFCFFVIKPTQLLRIKPPNPKIAMFPFYISFSFSSSIIYLPNLGLPRLPLSTLKTSQLFYRDQGNSFFQQLASLFQWKA